MRQGRRRNFGKGIIKTNRKVQFTWHVAANCAFAKVLAAAKYRVYIVIGNKKIFNFRKVYFDIKYIKRRLIRRWRKKNICAIWQEIFIT